MVANAVSTKSAKNTDNVDLKHHYSYGSLEDHSRETIRLLKLVPGETNTIECSMFLTDLSSQPNFKALSYVWGDQDASKAISIDGGLFLVRPNLWDFLRRLQRQDSSTYIWIDAICVNQEDIREREHQVSLMSKIYGQAESVIAWLGNDADRTLESLGIDAAISELEQLPAKIQLHEARHVRGFYEPDFSSDVVAALAELASRQYWKRAWIVQELVLSRKAMLWFGNSYMIPFSNFIEWASTSVDVAAHLQCLIGFTLSAANSRRLWPLDTVIQSFKDAQCADARDKVYAFLSLSDDGEVRGIRADYAKSTTELHLQLVHAYGGYYAKDFARTLRLSWYDPSLDFFKRPRGGTPSPVRETSTSPVSETST
jgi:hypothetical protein